MRRESQGCVVVVALGALLAVPPAEAAVFAVASGDVAGLIAAIDAANGNGEPDTINLAAGTYEVTTPQADRTALPEITSEIDLIGAGAATTELTRPSGIPTYRLLSVTSTGRLRVEGLTLSRGQALGAGLSGGAIRSEGSLTVVDCVLELNSTSNVGGAIASFAVDGGGLVVEGSELTQNSSSGSGGAIHAAGPFVLRDSLVASNGNAFGATVHWNGRGRALIEDSTIQGNTGGGLGASGPGGAVLEVVRTTIDGNSDEGARVSGDGMQVFFTDSTISNNTSDFAGGLFVGAKVVLRRSTVSGNVSTHPTRGGGGIYAGDAFGNGDLTVEWSTISGNVATSSGGGIYVHQALPRDQRVRIRASTITANTADSDTNGTGSGGGISALPGDVEIVGSILAGNVDQSGAAHDCAGAVVSQGHNLIGDAAGCGVTAATGDVVGAAPVLGPLAPNGGPTATHLPLAGSPALDAADPDACGAPDQRFFGPPADGDGDTVQACDIGAVEAGAAGAVALLSDFFLCHAARTSQGTPVLATLGGVQLADDVESKDFDVRKSTALCTPGDADGLGVADADTHLHARMIKETVGQPRHTKQLGLVLVNGLGSFTVDTVKPDSLLVPAAKGLAAFLPAPNPVDHDLDRYKCYKAKTSRGAPMLPRRSAALRVALSSQFFAARALSLNKVTKLCTSVDQEGDGRKNPAAHLLCFQARTVKPLLPGDREQTVARLHLASEWGEEQVDAKRAYDLCVPSLLAP